MNWYNRLNEYFPEEEMKAYGQLRDLIHDRDMYHKEETEDYLVLYGEFSSFVFVDYLLVKQKVRSKGVGSRDPKTEGQRKTDPAGSGACRP